MPYRCHLTPLASGDLPDLMALFTDPDSRLFLGGPVEPALAEARSLAWIESSSSDPVWAIRRHQDSAFVGYVILDSHHDGEDIEISYALLPRYWRQGYATEALAFALTHAFGRLGLPTVIAETQVKNLRSTRLLERIGMHPRKRVVRFGEEQVIYEIQSDSFRDPGTTLHP